MSSGSGSGSKGSDLTGAGIVDKGKGIVKEEEQEEGGGSKGKMMSIVQRADATAGGSCRRALHAATEHERRRQMSELFNNLQGLLPSLPDETDKLMIMMEVIQYIKTLEGTLSELEKRKQDRMQGISSSSSAARATVMAHQQPVGGIFQAWAAAVAPVGAAVPAVPMELQKWLGQNVVLSLSGDDAYINVCSARRAGLLTMVVAILEKYSIEVVTSEIASDSSRNRFTFLTRRACRGAFNSFQLPQDIL
ncbi:hypothetical protein BRADI_3g45370v3 [Brachypodium distachyon]|uniref:BHLH domain-containing protein n=1 Tax=Brachypodium distachyon TaxID=15368 RepID=A0A0Q3FJJ8_BRADI|nr:hypothetical protein BRADI_3g45370v3 [Brachypodium distachyon]